VGKISTKIKVQEINDNEIDTKEIRKDIWSLAWPAILRMGFQTSVGIITLILVGNYCRGAESVAAIGMAQRVMFLVIGTLAALSIGTTALVARFYGAGENERAKTVVSQSLLIGAGAAVLLALLLDFFGGKAIKLLMFAEPDPEVIALGGAYLKVIGYAMVLGLPMMVINAAQQGAGDMKTPMYMMIGVNVLTLIIGVLIIPGLGPFPALGLTGAALAEGLARAAGGVVALAAVFSNRFVVSISLRELWRWHPAAVKNILNIGLPAAGEQLVRQSSQIIYTILIASLGTVAIAANQVVMTVVSVSFMPGFGFGLAATTLVGQFLGAGKPRAAERSGYETNRFAAVFMLAMGTVFFIFAQPLAELFVPEAEVSALAAACLRIVAFAQLPLSVIMVLSGALRGAGDTRWVMYMTAGGQWGIRLLGTFAFISLGFGLVGVWAAMLLDTVVRGLLTFWRYRSGRWKTVFRPEPGESGSGKSRPEPEIKAGAGEI